VDVMLQSFAIMGQSINYYELQNADVVITPVLGNMRGNDFTGRNNAILLGEQAGMAAVAEIRRKLNAKRAP
jgi:NTE family protein